MFAGSNTVALDQPVRPPIRRSPRWWYLIYMPVVTINHISRFPIRSSFARNASNLSLSLSPPLASKDREKPLYVQAFARSGFCFLSPSRSMCSSSCLSFRCALNSVVQRNRRFPKIRNPPIYRCCAAWLVIAIKMIPKKNLFRFPVKIPCESQQRGLHR